MLAMLGVTCGSARADSGQDQDAAWSAWWKTQAGIKTWRASFDQTRSLATVSKPLKTTGRVWYAAPDFFRWEIGSPPQTIALRASNAVWIVYPKLRRAERYALGGASGQAWAGMASIFEAGFPQSRQSLDAQFRELERSSSQGLFSLSLAPRKAMARRVLSKLVLGIRGDSHALSFTAMHLADGSVLRNDFRDAESNTAIPDEARRLPDLEGYEIVEAGAQPSRP